MVPAPSASHNRGGIWIRLVLSATSFGPKLALLLSDLVFELRYILHQEKDDL